MDLTPEEFHDMIHVLDYAGKNSVLCYVWRRLPDRQDGKIYLDLTVDTFEDIVKAMGTAIEKAASENDIPMYDLCRMFFETLLADTERQINELSARASLSSPDRPQ